MIPDALNHLFVRNAILGKCPILEGNEFADEKFSTLDLLNAISKLFNMLLLDGHTTINGSKLEVDFNKSDVVAMVQEVNP